VGGRLSLYGLVIVGAKPNALYFTHSRSSFTLHSVSTVFFCCMPVFSFPSFFCTFLMITLSLSLSVTITHLSLSFLGIALYIKTCLEPHRIRTTHVPSTGLVSFLSCHYSSSFFLSACLTRCPLLGLLLVLVAVEGALSCLVLASCCLVLSRSKLIDRPFSLLGLIVCCLSFPFLVYFTSFLLSHLSVTHPQANVGLVCRIPVPLLSLTHSI
jgi:hypothetical protein